MLHGIHLKNINNLQKSDAISLYIRIISVIDKNKLLSRTNVVFFNLAFVMRKKWILRVAWKKDVTNGF